MLPGFSTKKQKQTWMWGRKAEEKKPKNHETCETSLDEYCQRPTKKHPMNSHTLFSSFSTKTCHVNANVCKWIHHLMERSDQSCFAGSHMC